MPDTHETDSLASSRTHRSMRRTVAVCVVAGAALGALVSHLVPDAFASRNSTGSYTLPPGNPVVPGTAISSSVHNATMADIAAEITDSLSRSGKGGMSAPLQLTGGSVGTPSLRFVGETATGLYRAAANTPAVAVSGVQRQSWTSTGTSVTGDVTASGVGSFTGFAALKLNGGAADNVYMEFFADAQALATRSAYVGFPTASTTVMEVTNEMGGGLVSLVAGGSSRLAVGATGVAIPGAGGTPFSGVFSATRTVDFPSIAAANCQTDTAALTGAAVTGVCSVSQQTLFAGTQPVAVSCHVTGANSVTLRACNASAAAIDPPSVIFNIRVIQ